MGEGHVTVDADTSKADRALEKSARLAEREAAKAAKAQASEVAKAAKAAEQAAAKMEADTRAAYGKISAGAAAMSSQVGGSFGQLGNAVNSILKPLAEVGTGFAVAGAAALQIGEAIEIAYGLSRAAVELANSAEESAESLRKQGFWVGPEAQKQLDRYTEGTRQLGQAYDELKVQAGAPVASELGVVAKALADNAHGAVDLTVRLSHLGDTVVDATIPFLGKARDLIRYGESSLYHALTDTTRATLDADAALKDLWKDYVDFGPSLDEFRNGKPTSVVIGAPTKADEEAARNRAAMLAQVTAEQSQIDQIVGASWLHLDATHAQYTVDAAQDEHDLTLSVLGENAKRKASDAAAAKAERDIWTDRLKTEANYAQGVIGSIGDIAQADVDSVQRRLDAGEHLSAGTLRQANLALEVAEAAAITQAGISATLIGIETNAALIPLIGPIGAAVAGSLAGGLSFGAAVAGIEAHRPPRFDAPSRQGHQDPGVSHEHAEDGGSAAEDGTSGGGGGKAQQNDALGSAARSRGGTTDRSSHGATLGLSPDASRLLRELRRAGKRDHRGRR